MAGGQRPYFIVSEFNKKVVDIRGAKDAAGAEVIMYHKKGPSEKNQLWYTDSQGFVRSCLNDMVFQGPKKGHELTMGPSQGNPGTQWRIQGNKIVNNLGECLDIRGKKDADGAELCAYDYKNQPNQHWIIEYV